MFETSRADRGAPSVLFYRAIRIRSGDIHTEDEAQDRFDQRQTLLQPETWDGRACLWEYLLYIRIEQIYASREAESEHPVVTLLCGAQSL